MATTCECLPQTWSLICWPPELQQRWGKGRMLHPLHLCQLLILHLYQQRPLLQVVKVLQVHQAMMKVETM